ncbi:MAG: acyl-CoA dehydrogenase family protein [Phycisphaerales bacterium]|nr:acyl-CoA dehydrogenase family protein [Phycisphaerales bacterium]
MDFRLDDDQRQLRDSLRAFCDKEIAPRAADRDHNGCFEDGLIAQLGELGVFGLYVPSEFGGAGLDCVSYSMMVEEISRACAATGILISAHHSLCVDPILRFGSIDQKQKFLPPLSSGEWIGAFSLTEPNSGSDAGAARCSAVERSNGWELNGTKCFVTNGLEAHVFVVFAVTDPDNPKRRLSAFIVEKGAPGFSIGKVEKKLGIRASSTVELVFEKALIPRDSLLGERGRGLRVALGTLDGGRVGVASQAVGISQAALDVARDYSKTRHAFGGPIAQFQAIQWKIADIATAVAAARLVTRRAAWLKQNERGYDAEAAMAKMLASETSSRVVNLAMQVFGGYGYINDYPIERLLRDAKITELYEGTSEIQRLVIARKLLSDPGWINRGSSACHSETATS